MPQKLHPRDQLSPSMQRFSLEHPTSQQKETYLSLQMHRMPESFARLGYFQSARVQKVAIDRPLRLMSKAVTVKDFDEVFKTEALRRKTWSAQNSARISLITDLMRRKASQALSEVEISTTMLVFWLSSEMPTGTFQPDVRDAHGLALLTVHQPQGALHLHLDTFRGQDRLLEHAQFDLSLRESVCCLDHSASKRRFACMGASVHSQ